VCSSVAATLEGKKLASFTGISTLVRSAMENAITRVLSPKHSVDVLAEVRAKQAKGLPYSIVFVGVNGVGKSTNLAKIAYWLRQQNLRVMIAACDTFRFASLSSQRYVNCACPHRFLHLLSGAPVRQQELCITGTIGSLQPIPVRCVTDLRCDLCHGSSMTAACPCPSVPQP
jgi:hypothetical protein